MSNNISWSKNMKGYTNNSSSSSIEESPTGECISDNISLEDVKGKCEDLIGLLRVMYSNHAHKELYDALISTNDVIKSLNKVQNEHNN